MYQNVGGGGIPFGATKKNDFGTYEHQDDPSGKSTMSYVRFDMKSGNTAGVACMNWSKKIETERNWYDHLRVTLNSKEFQNWIKYEAY